MTARRSTQRGVSRAGCPALVRLMSRLPDDARRLVEQACRRHGTSLVVLALAYDRSRDAKRVRMPLVRSLLGVMSRAELADALGVDGRAIARSRDSHGPRPVVRRFSTESGIARAKAETKARVAAMRGAS